MTLRLLLRVLLSTWALLIPLPWCLPSLWLMLVWLFALAVYAFGVLIPAVIDALRIDESLLPAELPDDRGLPEPSSYPPMPRVHQPFRLIGCNERSRTSRPQVDE